MDPPPHPPDPPDPPVCHLEVHILLSLGALRGEQHGPVDAGRAHLGGLLRQVCLQPQLAGVGVVGQLVVHALEGGRGGVLTSGPHP